MSSARNAGESAICRLRAQPSAEIVRVECAKRRRECDLPAARATLCGDRACRVREMQARGVRGLEFTATASFHADNLSQIPCSLMQKLPQSITLRTFDGQEVNIPAASRFLRFAQFLPHQQGGVESSAEEVGLSDVSGVGPSALDPQPQGYKVVFGLPWSYETFIQQACKAGHPLLGDHQVPPDLKLALDKNLEWNDHQMSSYRADWCRRWLKKAVEMKDAERLDADTRPAHVQANTKDKKVLLTEQILAELGYEDVQVLRMLREGATLAGDVEESSVFHKQYKPCMQTMDQLHKGATLKNAAILNMTRSSGDRAFDEQLLVETREEIRKGWARGPFKLEELEKDAVVSRRFLLQQGSKARVIDDYSVSGINDTCAAHNKVDLHMIDTLAALANQYFRYCAERQLDSSLVAKTYDLKSAYRQIPIRESHLKYAYFSIFNHETEQAEVYQMLTLPFGATHSVYCFLRFAKMLHFIAARGLFVMNTNFYDDFVLVSRAETQDSAKHAMELVFLLTGWEFAREGKKKTEFSTLCRALGVVFDFSLSSERKLMIENTEQRKQELKELLQAALDRGTLTRPEALVLRGKLGFADSFVHGRLGILVLSKLIEHAYGAQKQIDESLRDALRFMLERLNSGQPRVVRAHRLAQWFIYSDASYEQGNKTGGIGGVLVNDQGECVSWFGFSVDSKTCLELGASAKDTIIYELELFAGVLALKFWNSKISCGLQVWFGDNEAVRFSLIKGSAEGDLRLITYFKQESA